MCSKWLEHSRAQETTEGSIEADTCPGPLLGRSQVRRGHRIYPLIQKRKGAGIESREKKNKKKVRNEIWKNIVCAANYSVGFR